MRFTLVACSAAALAALAGCGGTPPPVADAAWTVNLTGASSCMIFNSTRMLGQVSVSTIQTRVDDGVNGVSVSCSVTGAGPYNVTGSASQGADILNISIPSLPSSATKAAPALGSVAYESDSTVSLYASSSCDFYFAQPIEGVQPGQVWVAFTCAALTDSGTGSSCPVIESTALFEHCNTM
jgi:hypothetical protein